MRSLPPGWVAAIDGVEQEVSEVQVFFMGLEVPKGRHVVTLDYGSRGLQLSLIIMLLSGLASLVMLCLPRPAGEDGSG